ncbi:14773_t:CDS:2 [Funneliformis geosporum]|uniref:Mediator of RNA polymerase II transcription subunit 4 n=1 Tax=Funneliformis geosporum TaxID=1117311 RepID=A0A9W4SRJ1_9GLOM|nr:14773_t:CDS:2 [Funneliformis geosporum]CAI2178992.1 9704_t:CDS:2 [Funneliformis geosporum]
MSRASVTFQEEYPNEITTPVKGYLVEYEALIDLFFSAIVAYSEGGKQKDQTTQTPVEIMKEIIALDKKLQKGLDLIEEHQRVHRKLLQMENEIDTENQAIMDLALALKTGKEQLEVCLEEARVTRRVIQTAQESQVSAEDILEYAGKLSQYTSAPPHFNPTMPSSMTAFPPYPDETRMRMGLIFRQGAEESFEEDVTHARSNSFGSVDITQQTSQTEAFNLDLNPDLE